VCAGPHPSRLIAARVVQALGWSLITPASIAVLLADVPVNRRATAVATWAGIGGIATAMGPSLGALARRRRHVAWAFWISVPIGLIVVPLGARTFREVRPNELVKGPLPIRSARWRSWVVSRCGSSASSRARSGDGSIAHRWLSRVRRGADRVSCCGAPCASAIPCSTADCSAIAICGSRD
jgi:MFS family permease